MTTMSAREFNQDLGAAKRAALREPVLITDRGEPSHVLLSISDYRKLTGEGAGWVHKIQMEADIDFKIPEIDFKPRIPEL